MRTFKAPFYKFLTGLFAFLLFAPAHGQSRKLEKTYTWEYVAAANPLLAFRNYDCDLVIHSWDQNQFKFLLSIDATMKSEEDASRLDAYLQGLKFSPEGEKMEIDNRYWKSRKGRPGKTTMVLKDGQKVSYTRFQMKGELWIPSSARIDLESKYSVIEMEDLHNEAHFTLYNDKLYARAIQANASIEAKYSTMEFTEMKDMRADLYSCEFDAARLIHLDLVSKYTKFRCTQVSDVKLDSYSDKFHFASCGNIHWIGKYSDLHAGNGKNLEFDTYSCNLIIAAALDVRGASKYGSYEIGKAQKLHLRSSYSDKIHVNNSLNELLLTESKYGDYRINELLSSLQLTAGYSDKFEIPILSSGFEQFSADGKYLKMELGLPADLVFRFKADVQYPHFDLDDESLDIKRHIKDGSSLKMEAVRGKELKDMPLINIRGYDVQLSFLD